MYDLYYMYINIYSDQQYQAWVCCGIFLRIIFWFHFLRECGWKKNLWSRNTLSFAQQKCNLSILHSFLDLSARLIMKWKGGNGLHPYQQFLFPRPLCIRVFMNVAMKSIRRKEVAKEFTKKSWKSYLALFICFFHYLSSI